MSIRSTSIALSALLSLTALAPWARADTYVVYTHDFARGAGAPVTEVEHFAAVPLTYTIRVYNGGKNQQFRRVVSAGLVRLNGEPLVTPQEFNQRRILIEKRADLLLQNELVVELRSAPGSGITIEILGIVELELAYTENLQLAWWNPPIEIPGGVHVSPSPEWSSFGAYYRPVVPPGYHSLGSYGECIPKPWPLPYPRGFMLLARELEPGALAAPLDYDLVWDSQWMAGTFGGAYYGLPRGTFWRPVAPPGYVALGLVVKTGVDKPDLDAIRCVRADLTVPGEVGPRIWNNHRALQPPTPVAHFGTWQVERQDPWGIHTGALVGALSQTTPPPGPFACIDARHVKSVVDGLFKMGWGDVVQLVETSGPSLRLHPGEIYLPDEVEHCLDLATLEWGLVTNEWNYSGFNMTLLGSYPTSAAGLMVDVASLVDTDPERSNPEFRHWLRMPEAWRQYPGSGNLSRARVYVRVLPWNWLFTEIQFWVYFPFNGAGRLEICASSSMCVQLQLGQSGRHYSDWEHVTLRFLNSSRDLAGVYLSQHAWGQWLLQRDFGGALGFDGTHPVVYLAKYSHAAYPRQGTHYYERIWSYDWGLGTASMDLFDLTGNGSILAADDPGVYSIFSSDMPGYWVVEPDWLRFEGRWGQYERLIDSFPYIFGTYDYTEVGAGPSGPAMKGAWTGEKGPGSW